MKAYLVRIFLCLVTCALLAGLAAARTIEFETTEVTAADVALSPDGQTLVFTMLGHLFRLPVEGATSAPVIPGLGFALGTRAQMFYLEEGLAKSLAPGKQPSSSLTPTLVLKDGQPYLAFGTPGGDLQDQITLQFFLNVVDFGMGLQDAVDAPQVWTRHFPSLFYPHRAHPGEVDLADPSSGNFPDNTVEVLEAKGHKVRVLEGRRGGGTMVVMRDPKTGTLAAAAGQRRPPSLALAW